MALIVLTLYATVCAFVLGFVVGAWWVERFLR